MRNAHQPMKMKAIRQKYKWRLSCIMSEIVMFGSYPVMAAMANQMVMQWPLSWRPGSANIVGSLTWLAWLSA